MINISKCEELKTSEDVTFYIGESNEEYSEGYLELVPHSSLTLHNRPGIETLTQIKGNCCIIQFENNVPKTTILNEGDKIVIQQKIWHIHANPFDKPFLQHWYLKGDIRHIINSIKQSKK